VTTLNTGGFTNGTLNLSGTWNFTVSRDDIIREAMLNIGKVGEGTVITAGETADCARKLNMLVKQWMGKQDFAPGLKMWTRQRADLFLSSTQYVYELGPTGDNWVQANANGTPGYVQTNLTANLITNEVSVLVAEVSGIAPGYFLVIQLDSGDIYSTTVQTSMTTSGPGILTIPLPGMPSGASMGNYVWCYPVKAQRPLEILPTNATVILRDINANDTPMTIMTLQDYENLPTKTMPQYQTDPSAVYYESQLNNGYLFIDCSGAQDVTKHLHIVSLRPVMDINNPLDVPEYPQQWFRALCWGLSKEIAPMFNAVWTKEMDDNRRDSLAMAQEADAETTSMYFQPGDANPWGV